MLSERTDLELVSARNQRPNLPPIELRVVTLYNSRRAKRR